MDRKIKILGISIVIDHVQVNHHIVMMAIQAIQVPLIQGHSSMKLIIVDRYMYKHRYVQMITVAFIIQLQRKQQTSQMNVLLFR